MQTLHTLHPATRALTRVAAGVALVLSTSLSAVAATATLTAGAATSVVVSDPSGSGKAVALSIPRSGDARLDFSNGLTPGVKSNSLGGALGLFNVSKITWSAQGGGVANESKTILANGRGVRGLISLISNISEITVDSTTGALSTIRQNGEFSLSQPYIESWAMGGKLKLRNVRIDFSKRQVVADLITTLNGWNDATQTVAPGIDTYENDIALWTFDAPTGAKALALSALASNNATALQAAGLEIIPNGQGGYNVIGRAVLPNLRLTPLGTEILGSDLGWGQGSTYYDSVSRINTMPYGWGNLSLTWQINTGNRTTCTP
jgi:hypothetical protein